MTRVRNSCINKDYIRSLVETGEHSDGRKDERFKDVDVDFLDEERVELDAILAKVGDERFFQYIMDTLKDLYPKWDYIQIGLNWIGIEQTKYEIRWY